jgi:hypothetical protein
VAVAAPPFALVYAAPRAYLQELCTAVQATLRYRAQAYLPEYLYAGVVYRTRDLWAQLTVTAHGLVYQQPWLARHLYYNQRQAHWSTVLQEYQTLAAAEYLRWLAHG